MSAEAIERVAEFKHPKVKGSRRKLLERIAALIPPGQTMTPLLAIEDFVNDIGYSDSSTRAARDVLVDLRLVRVVGGGQGRPAANYELLLLAGAGQEDPTLPLKSSALIAEVRPLSKARVPDGGLFDQVDIAVADLTDVSIRADHFAGFRRSVVRKPRRFPAMLVTIAIALRRFPAMLVTYFAGFRRRWSFDIAGFRRSVPTVVDVDDVRARATYNNLRTTTTSTAADAAPEKRKPPRCPWHGTVHAWCDGRVHVPTPFHQEELRKLPRRPGQTDADRDAEQFAIYADVLSGIPDETKILDKTEFIFWNRVLRGTTPTRRTWISFRRPPPSVRHEGAVSGGNCPHTPRCADDGSVTASVVCRDRSLADARAERERKSG